MKLVILGDPVGHSLSPAIHNAGFAASGLLGEYSIRQVDDSGMRAAVAEIRDGVLAGANVTMPHKELAAQLCDRLSPATARAGAVNTLVRSAQAVVGHNTDITGIRAAWAEAGLAANGPVHVLGSGGAAAAALLALEGRPLHISARKPESAIALADRVAVPVTAVPWETPVPGAVVVNATPLGMAGEELPESVIASAGGLFDMAYGAGPTPAVARMFVSGRAVADGPAMLLHQAAAAFELWTGHPAPIAAMRAALPAGG